MAAMRRLARLLVLVPALLSFARAQSGLSDADAAVRRLAAKLPAGPFSTNWQNLSTLSPDDVSRIRAAFEAAVPLTADGAALRVTVSENPRHFLLTVQLADSTWMESWPKPVRKAARPPHRLRVTPVWEQARRILDLQADEETLRVLEPDRIVTWRRMNGAWKQESVAALAPLAPVARDPRGKFEPGEVWLAGQRCTPASPRWTCAKSDWMVPGRNYFAGPAGPYFSAVEGKGGTLQVGVDGRARWLAQGRDAVTLAEDWGGDAAAIEASCGAFVLGATRLGQQLQAFALRGLSLEPVTEPWTVEGTVVALWPAGGGEALLVTYQRQAGLYEASRVALLCAQ
jgi:hypothetical protein